MRKFAIAFLRNPNPSLHNHAFKSKSDTASVLSFNSLATGYEVAKSEDGAVGVSRCRALSEAMEKETRRMKADIVGCVEQDARRAKESLHVEISTVKAKKSAKARPKPREKAANAEELNHMVAGEKATELAEFSVLNAEKCSTETAVISAENVAVYNTNRIHAQGDISEYAAKLELNTYKCGSQWEATACKLLDNGISFAHVIKMLQKCKNLACTRNCVDSTLQHFKTLGMSHEEMGRAVSQWPTVLNITNTMFQSKLEFFERGGIDRLTLGKMIYNAPVVITYSLIALRQYWDFWNNYMQDIEANAICIMIVKDPKLLTYSLQKSAMPKIAYLEEQGYDKKMLLKHSLILGMSMEAITSRIKLLEQFGMSNARKRSWGLAVLHGISNSSLHLRFHNLLVSGFSLDQVQNIISKSPQVLCLTEDHIRMKLSYAVDVMNLSLDALVMSPTYWSHSFEKRIKYRYEVITKLRIAGALQKEVALGYMVCMTNADFTKRFVERFQDRVKHADTPSV